VVGGLTGWVASMPVGSGGGIVINIVVGMLMRRSPDFFSIPLLVG